MKNQNNLSYTYLDTLYSGCTIGSYGVLLEEDYTIACKAVDECTVLKLRYKKLSEFRDSHYELDERMAEYEQYVMDNGLPYCDYKLNHDNQYLDPKQKFQNGVRRIMRIVKSYKSNAFTDLLVNIQEQLKKERQDKKRAYRK